MWLMRLLQLDKDERVVDQGCRRGRAAGAKQHQDLLLPRVEVCLRCLQVGSFKALAETIVHRLQKAAGLGDTALILL